MVLEQGHWTNPSDFPGDKPEYELVGGKPWNPGPQHSRQRPRTTRSTLEDVRPAAISCTTAWAGEHAVRRCWSRALPSDFRVRTLDGVADDWPITYEELEPFYRRRSTSRWASPAWAATRRTRLGQAPPLPPHPINKTGRKMAEGMNKLGWHWWPGYNAIPTPGLPAPEAVRALGVCRMGCPRARRRRRTSRSSPTRIEHGARGGDRCPGRGGHAGRERPGQRCVATSRTARSTSSPRSGRDLGGQRNRHAAGAADVGVRAVPRRPGEPLGPGRQAADDPPVRRHRSGSTRTTSRTRSGPTGEQIESMEFYETDKIARLRARLQVADQPDHRPSPNGVPMDYGGEGVRRGVLG